LCINHGGGAKCRFLVDGAFCEKRARRGGLCSTHSGPAASISVGLKVPKVSVSSLVLDPLLAKLDHLPDSLLDNTQMAALVSNFSPLDHHTHVALVPGSLSLAQPYAEYTCKFHGGCDKLAERAGFCAMHAM